MTYEIWDNRDDYPAGSSIYNAPVVNYGQDFKSFTNVIIVSWTFADF